MKNKISSRGRELKVNEKILRLLDQVYPELKQINRAYMAENKFRLWVLDLMEELTTQSPPYLDEWIDQRYLEKLKDLKLGYEELTKSSLVE